MNFLKKVLKSQKSEKIRKSEKKREYKSNKEHTIVSNEKSPLAEMRFRTYDRTIG